MTSQLPSLPVKHQDFVQYLQSNQGTSVQELVSPFNDYDAVARKIYAQEPLHALVTDNHANIVPLYDTTGSTNIRTRARDLTSETPEEKEKYLLPLSQKQRRPNGSAAVVPTLSEFQNNFTLFTEGALSDLDWNNVVAAGSAVVTSLLPVPEKYRNSKRGLRQYYHDEFAPASDVDLFLYGLTEEEAIEKIKHIEDKIRNTILYETTTIRTKNTITIASQYPTRHVQIVLRIYKSVAEILTGFDVDCSCAAYDGRQVYASPRAIASYVTQINQIDLTRRSPSYENRLSKYSHRGFEVFWAPLDRSRVDPTVFERSFMRTEGLARLLVLEKLPKTEDRDSYLSKRREERGRPPLSVYLRRRQGKELHGNIKDDWEDEVPEWQEGDQISDYHTFTIPYGRRFNARKIEKLLYTKDLLLNAQWNQKKDRSVYLHRHPAFFGEAEHVIGDCCGYCPAPVTEEEQKIAEEESKIYISGEISFIKDDPGRQEIGSFNPITETDWTNMAYIGHTERLCQAIVAHDLDTVKQFFEQENSDPDRRDCTGRTPLQLACMTSTPEIVQCLVDRGARLIARMADGQTALHLAAARGATEIVRILLTKSNENEEIENQKNESSRPTPMDIDGPEGEGEDDASHTSASYVKVTADSDSDDEVGPTFDTLEENELDPDIYDINVTAWDNLASPLHLAIIHGHVKTVKELVTSFGADVLMPIKITNEYSKRPEGAIMTLVMVLGLPLDKAREMSQALLELGASPAQADTSQFTVLHYIAQSDYTELLDLYREHDGPAVQRAINHMALNGLYFGSPFQFYTPLLNALCAKSEVGVQKLIEMGANITHELADCEKAIRSQKENAIFNLEEQLAENKPKQPILVAIENDLPLVAIDMLKRGVDPNTEFKQRYGFSGTALDMARHHLKQLKENIAKYVPHYYSYGIPDAVVFEQDDEAYLAGFQEGTYQMVAAKAQLKQAKEDNKKNKEHHATKTEEGLRDKYGEPEKREILGALISKYEQLEAELLSRNAKTWEELHPKKQSGSSNNNWVDEEEEKKKDKSFEIKFFHWSGLTDITRDGYLKLFEAAWIGDLDTIKSLTLSKWGPNNDQMPLYMSMRDTMGFSALNIAVLRGHLRVAEAILQILRAQYKVKEPEAPKHFEVNVDSGSDSDDDSDGEGLDIVGHTVDDQFTIENIGEVASKVESKVSPLRALMGWLQFSPVELFQHETVPSEDTFQEIEMNTHGNRYGNNNVGIDTLFRYAIYKNDLPLLEWLLSAGHECDTYKIPNEQPFSLGQQELQLAMALGHTECLGKIIQSTAAGLPLAKMSEQSGVSAREELQYYPGLSIRGQKRKDWADAGRPDHSVSDEDISRPPVLVAALQGNMASTEWLLGTAPTRYYLEYVNSHLQDKNIERLSKSQLGLDASVLKWLQTRNNLVLHCAVMSRPCAESEKLVQYLVDHHPECLEVKCSEGHTPLALAISLHRQSFARILIEAGASQSTRDNEGRNLLHLAVCSRTNETIHHATKISSLISLLDKAQVTTMLTQRSGESSHTPFARWLQQFPSLNHTNPNTPRDNPDIPTPAEAAKDITALFISLGSSTNQSYLDLLDGSGNTPSHDCVNYGYPQILELLLDARPDLLYRENATGSTPLDLAVDAWVNQTTRNVPQLAVPEKGNMPLHWQTKLSLRKEYFANDVDWRTKERIMVDVCRARAARSQSQSQQEQGLGGGAGTKRRLVTLYEANEVAKRLAKRVERSTDEGEGDDYVYSCRGRGVRFRRGREYRRYNRGQDDGLDEVALWNGFAQKWE